MSTSKLALIFASLALALAWAVTTPAANAAEIQTAPHGAAGINREPRPPTGTAPTTSG